MLEITRRSFMKNSAAIALSGASGTFVRQSWASGARLPFGLQLYSVDEDLRQDFEGTLRSIRAIGYREVELVGYYGRTAGQIKQALAAADLRAASIHLRPQQPMPGLPTLEQDPQRHFAICKDLGVRHVVCPGPWLPERVLANFPAAHFTKEAVIAAVARFERTDWKRSAELLDSAAAQAKQFGLQFLYHNGNFEFVPVGGVTGFDQLLRLTNAKLVKLELDCGWVMAAGFDPITYLKALRGRVPMIHIKDMQITTPNVAMELASTEMGTGIVDWTALLQAARATGVRMAYVEQEAPFTLAPLESARRNYQFLSGL